MLVVTPCDEFVLTEKEDWPDPYLVADRIMVLDFDMQDFGRRWSFKADQGSELVANDEKSFRREAQVRKNAKEYVDYAELKVAQAYAVGIVIICVADQRPIQHAARRDIAFVTYMPSSQRELP